MPRHKNKSSIRDRLGQRQSGLSRKSMPDGGEVFGGPTASKALSALGARAFTMDETIFVDDGFDTSNPEDLALYAHESHHKAESGGRDDGHSAHDAEEIAARARERMVLHMAKQGEDASTILSQFSHGGPKSAEEAEQMLTARTSKAGEPAPMDAYHSLLSTGMPHEQIVKDLAEHIVRTLSADEEDEHFRRSANG